MLIALSAVVVIWALYVVLPPCVVALKIKVATVAGPVEVRIALMLLKGTLVWKPSRTPVAVRHGGGRQEKRV